MVIDNKLGFSEHLAEKINKANRIVGLIRRTFVALDEEIFKCLYVAMVRPHLEYANQIWAPFLIKDIEAVENVQRRASKLVPSLKNLTYEERLRKLGLPTLTYRRARGDMIETYKILSGVYDKEVSQDIFVLKEGQRTRGHTKRIFKVHSRLNKNKYSFFKRVVNNWNQLPQWVIDSDTVKGFEARLDKVWRGQELFYNYRAKIRYSDALRNTATTMQNTSVEPDVQA